MVLNAKKKTRTILFSSLCTLVINLILDYILYYLIGITGPAWATVISVASMNIVQLIFTTKLLNIKFLKIYPVIHIIKVLIGNIFLGIIFYNVQKVIFSTINVNRNLITIILGIVWALVYFIFVHKKMGNLWKLLNQ